VLAERADPSAAGYAAEAIALCRRHGSAEQLAATLPTAAMVSWQVGELDAARRYIAEAQPLLGGTRRIARVVLLSTAAGVALADGDAGAAIELGGTADREGTDLGIERELPLVRAVVARAWLDQGNVTAAARQGAAAVQAATSLSFTYPLAVGLETAALVCLAAGHHEQTTARLLAAAAQVRERGDRPGIPTLRPAVDRARAAVAGLDTGEPSGPAAASELALAVLGSLAELSRN
jgi:ATP/maltotriose-dependent transcriptional regulator MalT